MRNFLAAYGGKILAWAIGVAALFTVPATAQSVHLGATAVAWIAIVLAALNLAHSIFFTPEQVLAAKAALKSAWKS